MGNYKLSNNHFLDQQASYDKAGVVILPVPFERTVSYGGGTKNGPAAILQASHFVETYDRESNSEPYTICIHTAGAVLPEKKPEKMIAVIEKKVAELINARKFPVILGGEHTLSIGTIYGALKKYPDLSVLHFDAHTDMRSKYQGDPYSHACVMYHVRLKTKNTVSVGIRSMGADEMPYINKQKPKIFYAEDIAKKGMPIKQIIKDLKKDVFISFDVDAFDPAFLEQTGTPEPGGLGWYQTLDLLREVFKTRNVIGCDVVELAPNSAHPNADFTIASLIYKMIGFKFA